MGLRNGSGMMDAFVCACGRLKTSGALVSALKDDEQGGLTRFNSPVMHDLKKSWLSNCRL